ncbi:ricin-type beta-trefoil lectin domain protein [Streptomyces sp. 5-8]|uniref:Ricin-type beta-trefoil lectin domain protein n=1 Tax=Streptomyces musisoli TaxID=2802280 RepID=A0ABS1NW84_9ACTN|nr:MULTISPECIES: RICIN domain-containing protein [Streptomyces]MBL1104375.1 ricin-type beta-trefoil lectin domain protein [Streptomyces musisoli]MBY8840348.1 RICIN domain-containing protein [Streptomyces sp. SP2-10]
MGVASLALTLGATQPVEASPSAPAATGPRIVDISSLSELPAPPDANAHTTRKPSDWIMYRYQRITSRATGNLCLDADANTIPQNGTKVQLWGCNGNDNQVWYFSVVSTGNYYVQTGQGFQCLDADANTIPQNGTKVQLWGCTGGRNQVWYPAGNTLRNLASNTCLDADANTIPNYGTKIQLWGCISGSANQQWSYYG